MKVLRAPWPLDDGRVIHLVREEELNAMPDGTVLYSIMGNEVVKGKDYIDNDTRAGMLAFGLLADHPMCLLSYETNVNWDEDLGS